MSLDKDEYLRYGRQMQVPSFNSLTGQLNLKHSKILVVGCGGLGSSALLYLAACGVGYIGVLDFDKVELSNLHRQIIHDSTTIGMYKTESAAKKMRALNPNLEINEHTLALTNLNSVELFRNYDLVLDCTDSPITKYLISDTCVVLHKPLISASSVKTDGQLIILNYQNGPCYRCIHPTPPKPENVSTCGDNGVIGPCVGLVGTLMATETIKILTNYYDINTNPYKPTMLMYSGYMENNGQIIKSFKMRGAQPYCLCNSMNEDTIKEMNYLEFCGKIDYNVLDDQFRIDFSKLCNHKDDSIILDLRPKEQFDISNLLDFDEGLNLVNISYSSLIRLDDESLNSSLPSNKKILTLCKMGNDSRLAANYLISKGYNALDLRGGLNEYSKSNDFNVYW